MNIKSVYLFIICALLSSTIQGQKTAIYTDVNAAYKQGMNFYEEGLFGLAMPEFERVMEENREAPKGSSAHILKERAQMHHAFSAIRLDHPDGEKLALDFIRTYEPSVISNLAKYELGNYYYNAQDFEKALEYYDGVETLNLSNDQINDLRFKQAYANFVRKKFAKSRGLFRQIKEIENQYYYPSNYYYGVCAFFEDDYDEALKSFQKVNKSKKYSKVVPYYICQIYFAEKRYDELIAYAEPIANDNRIKYQTEINQLVGQSHFEMGNYDKALPYLKTYVDNTGAGKLSQKEVYQLAYTYYKTGNYAEAIKHFEELREEDSPMAQNALYNLADSYLQTGQKNTARSAFLAASKMEYDADIQQDCVFNYAKLSYELGYDREAINTILSIKPGTRYYADAQTLLGNILLSTSDYARSLEIIESLPNRNEKIEEAYQKVAYYRGVQLYKEGNQIEAEGLFQKAAKRSYDLRTKGLAYYWLGEIAYNNKQYDPSIEYYGRFQSIANTQYNLPDESSVHTSNYSIAYNYWKKGNYNAARKYFEDATEGIRSNFGRIKNDYVKSQVLPDATLRTADCYLKANNYEKAKRYYNEVISNQYDGFEYAMYQKAIILGLQKQSIDKILELERIYTNYPNSFYGDDAIFELGHTYLRLGKLDNASETFLTMLEKYPNSPLTNKALLKLGLIYVNQDQNEKGLEYFKRVFANNPDEQTRKDALNGIEEIYINMDDTEGYFAFLESIPGYDVSTIARDSIMFKAAETQYGNGDYMKAAQSYTSYLKRFPNNSNSLSAYFRRAESYLAIKAYDEALKDYDVVLQRLPNAYGEAAAKKSSLIAYNIKEDFAAAYTYYMKFSELATTDDDKYKAQIGALRSAYRSGNSEAVFALADVVTNSSKSNKAEKGAAQYYLGQIALANKEYDKARDAFRQVIVLTEDERAAEARYQIAYIYYLERDLDVAQELCLNTNTQIQGYDYWLAKSVILLADIFVEKGDFFNARASLESIIENYTGDPELLQEAKDKLEKLNSVSEEPKFRETPDPDADLEMDDPIDDSENNNE